MRPGAVLRAGLFLVVAAFAGGALVGRAPLLADLAELRVAQAESARLAATAAVRRLDEAQQRGNELTEQLLGREREIEKLTKEKRHAVAQTTSGTTCLNAGTVRVLNGAAGLRFAAPPETASSAAAADGPVATDSDVGPWIVEAGAQYEKCRERLHKLIDWERETP